MRSLLLSPPVAFIVVLAVSWLILVLCGKLSCKPGKLTEGASASYASGEKNYDAMVQPDYSQFFVFAFFFTLAHVAVLMMTMVPIVTLDIFFFSIVYLIGVVIGLVILLRKK
jgi:NADH:ubiquinone oxidoreductase subunit 3 (subunit A)